MTILQDQCQNYFRTQSQNKVLIENLDTLVCHMQSYNNSNNIIIINLFKVQISNIVQ